MKKEAIITKNLRRIMKEKRIKQRELAEMLGTSRQQISSYMNGRAVPSALTIYRICEALEISQYDLTATESDRDILRLGRLVLNKPALYEISDMIGDGRISNNQLQKILDMIASFA